MHCSILKKFYSFSHQIILSSYSVPVREVISLTVRKKIIPVLEFMVHKHELNLHISAFA